MLGASNKDSHASSALYLCIRKLQNMERLVQSFRFVCLLFPFELSNLLSFPGAFFLNKRAGERLEILRVGGIALRDIVQKGEAISEKGNKKQHYGTSETLRNETVMRIATMPAMPLENIKYISEHVPKHLKPVTDDQFGHYLAGLIDGSGEFSSKQQLVIEFSSLDASLAYYIKKRVGFGSVKRVATIKDKNAFLLIIAAKKGIEKVIELINGKIRTVNKFNQINSYMRVARIHENYVECRSALKTINFNLNSSGDFKNH